MTNLAKARAGHIGGTACYEKYGKDYFSALGKLGGRPRLPSLDQLRVEPASRSNIIGGERLPNGLNDLKKLWKLELLRRGSAVTSALPQGG